MDKGTGCIRVYYNLEQIGSLVQVLLLNPDEADCENILWVINDLVDDAKSNFS